MLFYARNIFKLRGLISKKQFFFASTFQRVKEMEDSTRIVYKTIDDEAHFTLSFRLKSGLLDRDFNFKRNKNEAVNGLLEVIRNKIDKIKDKKSKSKKKKKAIGEEIEPPSSPSSTVQFRLDDEEIEIDEETSAVEILSRERIQLEICGILYLIDKNPPIVETLKLSPKIMAGFTTYPSKFEISFGSKKYSTFDWFLSTKTPSSDWKLRQRNKYFFKPDPEDVGKFVKLRVTPKNYSSRTGSIIDIVSENPIEPGPSSYIFEKRHLYTREPLGNSSIRVVSYNLLANLYADSEFSRTVLHPLCPTFALSINYRKQLILKELMGYNADVICLQEVDQKVFKWDLSPFLSEIGFDGVFETKGGDLSEGLACFWRKSEFDFGGSKILVMSDMLKKGEGLSDVLPVIQAKEPLNDCIMKIKTAVLFVNLKPKNVEKTLLICNTHLFFQPQADHIRLLQTELCVREIKRLMNKNSTLLFCGDFNSVPSNGVYEYLTGRKIPSDHPDWKSCIGQEVEGLCLSHDFDIGSACGKPKFTNYTQQFKDCLDYIFYDINGFEVERVIPFPTENELGEAIPNEFFPSDHIACVADLKWK